MKESFLSRNRKFNPKNFFLSILNLTASSNQDGLSTALRRAWQDCGLHQKQTPSKSSLSEYREKVSFTFLKEIWQKHLQSLQGARKKLRGFYIYAIDGDDLDLPASEEILSQGYKGYPFSKKKETYYPKMYTVQAVDIINGLVTAFSQSAIKQEVVLAREMVRDLEQKSIVIYDRLHDSYATVRAHYQRGNYFLIRVKDQCPTQHLEVRSFCQSKKRSKWVTLRANYFEKKKNPSVLMLRVRLMKVRNPRSGKDLVLMTNLTQKQFKDEEIACLYQRRWEVESSFRDLTHTLKMNQWHTKKLNGILQEVYALLWLVNQVKIQIAQMTPMARWLGSKYQKANFKLCMEVVLDHLSWLAQGQPAKLQRILQYWARRSIEKREHLSRNYPRQFKYSPVSRKYKHNGSVKRRA